MKNITDRYKELIESLECDMTMILENKNLFYVSKLVAKDDDVNTKKNLELLRELSRSIRNDKVRILQLED